MLIQNLKYLAALVITACLTLGCSPSSKEVLITKQQPTSNAASLYDDYLNRDIRDDVFYFVLPDRFYNGNPANDNGSSDIEISKGGFKPDDKFGFHGGDINGVEQKLDYLKELGITAIWMTPILRNKAIQWGGYAHHGYWIVDFTQIDPHFGSNDDLKSLIDAAHQKGIKIFFDIITNHTADVIRFEECHNPDGSFKGEKTCEYKTLQQVNSGDNYTPFLPVKEKDVKVPAWLNDPKYYHNQGDSFWQGESAINGDFVGLDDLNTLHPEVITGMIDIYKNIITEFKPDGFRIDTVKHVHMPFWQAFSPAIVEHAKSLNIPNFHIFGEVYSGDPVVLSNYTTDGKMPSVLDFGFQSAAADVFYRGKDPQTIATLFDNDDYYNDQDSNADILMNFLGNHDMGRAGYFIDDANPDISDEERLRRNILSHALMYFSRGVPVIYYGDEQGFTGDGGDVGARENMFASKVSSYNDNNLIGTDANTAVDNFDQSHPIYTALSELSKIRSQHTALRQGITANRYFNSQNQTFAFSRVDKQEKREYLAVFNAGTQAQTITFEATSNAYKLLDGNASFTVNSDEIEISIAGLSYVLLKANEPIQTVNSLDIELTGIEKADERVKFNYRLLFPESNHTVIQLAQVTTELVTNEGDFVLVAKDNTAPYCAIVLQKIVDEYNPAKIRVTIDNGSGEINRKVFDIPQ